MVVVQPVRVDDPGRRTRVVRLTSIPRVVCPAGTKIHEMAEGSAVRCGIEERTITAAKSPSSLMTFCCNSDYAHCPSWQAARDWEEEGYGTGILEGKLGDDGRQRSDMIVERDTEAEITYFEQPD